MASTEQPVDKELIKRLVQEKAELKVQLATVNLEAAKIDQKRADLRSQLFELGILDVSQFDCW